MSELGEVYLTSMLQLNRKENERGEQMSKTSSEVKNRWDAKTYKKYTLLIRKDEDKVYIDYIDERRKDGESLAEIIKEALDLLMAEGSVNKWK